MQLETLFTDETDRGASPVIGVILMVAITVILAAVIGAFVLGTGDEATSSAPQASFEFDFEDQSNVTITHGGGEDIDNSTIEVTVDGDIAYPNASAEGVFNSTPWGSPIATGDSVTIYNGSDPGTQSVSGGETIRIIWINPSGGESNTIDTTDWPN